MRWARLSVGLRMLLGRLSVSSWFLALVARTRTFSWAAISLAVAIGLLLGVWASGSALAIWWAFRPPPLR